MGTNLVPVINLANNNEVEIVSKQNSHRLSMKFNLLTVGQTKDMFITYLSLFLELKSTSSLAYTLFAILVAWSLLG